MNEDKDKKGKKEYIGTFKKEQIINAIIDMRLNKSASNKFIVDFLINDIKLSQTQAYVYLKEAKNEIAKIYKDLNIAAVEEAVYQIEEMMQWAKTNKNFKLWMQLRVELNKIKGVYAAEKIDIKGDLNHNISVIKLSGPGHDKEEDK